jgi:hypothetical protein
MKVHQPAGGSLYHYKVKWLLLSFSMHTSRVLLFSLSCSTAAVMVVFADVDFRVTNLLCSAQWWRKTALSKLTLHNNSYIMYLHKLHITTNQMYAAVNLQKPTVLHLVNKYPQLMKLKGSILRSRQRATCLCFAPSCFLTSHCNIAPHTRQPSALSFRFTHLSLNPHACHMPCRPKSNIWWVVRLWIYTHITIHTVITDHHQKNLKHYKLNVN